MAEVTQFRLLRFHVDVSGLFTADLVMMIELPYTKVERLML